MDQHAAFGRLIDALRPWLDEVVIVGGWAHRLYRHTQLVVAPAYEPVQTLDADVAFSLDTQFAGNIAEALAAADFREQLTGEHKPPVSHYALGTEDTGFYAEFLAPLRGSGVKRTGEPDATVMRAGISAQKLRHLDLLLLAPITVTIGTDGRIPMAQPAEVRIPDPTTFIAQKLLIRSQRLPEKRPQDVLYIHDTLELFQHQLPALRTSWTEQCRPKLAAATARRVERRAAELFRHVNDDIQRAARIPADRMLRPERMQRTCAYGMRAIFEA